MHTTTLLASADTITIMIPFLAIMFMVMFRLDERLGAPRTGRGQSTRKGGRIFCEMGREGESVLTDPDGRPWPI